MAKDWQWKVALAAISVAAVTLIYSQRRRRWKAVGKLSKICIYPLKSGRFKEISSAECTPLGLKASLGDGYLTLRDRVFVIYDEKMNLVSGAKCSTLVFVNVEPTPRNTVIFSYPSMPDIEISVPIGKLTDKTITHWRNEQVRINDCGDEIAEWISKVALGEEKGLRMSYWPEEETWRRDVLAKRPQEVNVFKKFQNRYTGAYSDIAGYMLICQSTIDDLNKRMVTPSVEVHPLDCRPNFIIEGSIPQEEDKWDRIKIGEVEFTNFRPCTRCVFTTVNHLTGTKHPKDEPLKTLRTYRTMKMLGEERVEGSLPALGIFLGLETGGLIKQGDTVYVS